MTSSFKVCQKNWVCLIQQRVLIKVWVGKLGEEIDDWRDTELGCIWGKVWVWVVFRMGG